MSLNASDKKIVIILVPLLVVLGYWFLVLGPKREETGRLADTLAKAETRRDAAQDVLRQAESTRNSYAKDYATVVRLGKAIPSDVDMPSLLVQLDQAAKGTNIRFAKIAAGARTAALTTATAPATAPAPPAPGSAAPASEAGGADAATAPGKATESANETAAAANDSSGASATAAGSPPAGTATTTTTTTTGTAAPTALDTVPLTFSFDGRFADLADFFHEMKRFVRVANDRVKVDGRLMKIDGFTFDSTEFPTIKAEVTAMVYLAPKTQGATAGATPQGPAAVTTTTASPAPAAAPSPSAPAAPATQGASQ